MHGAITDRGILRQINFHRYRERMGLSYQDAMQEPAEEIERAFLIWDNDHKRDKLKAAQRPSNAPQ